MSKPTPQVCPRCGKPVIEKPALTSTGLDTFTLCPDCDAERILAIDDRSAKIEQSRLMLLRVPEKFRHANIYNLMQYPEEVRKFQKGIIFYGESGVGKTYQMFAWLRYALINGLVIEYKDWSHVVCALRSAPSQFMNILSIANDCDVIAIDDFTVDNNYTYDYVYSFIKAISDRNIIVYMTCDTLPAQDKIASRLGSTTVQYEVRNEWN